MNDRYSYIPFRFLLPTEVRTGTSTSTCRLVEGLFEAVRELVAIAITSSSSSDMALVLAGVITPGVSFLKEASEPARGVEMVVGGEIGVLIAERVDRVGRDIAVVSGKVADEPHESTLDESEYLQPRPEWSESFV